MISHFYTKGGKLLGQAVSLMRCGLKADHKPHHWSVEPTFYAPYMCEGKPKVTMYDQPSRKPVN